MRATLLFALLLTVHSLLAKDATAETINLSLNVRDSGISVADGQGEAVFGWADGAYLELVTGQPDGSVLPFQVPVSGLRLGDVDSAHRSSLRIELLEPAQGTIRRREGDRFELRLTAQIRATDIQRNQSRTYQIELTTEKPASPVPGEDTLEGKRLDPTTGALDLVSTGRVLRRDGTPAGVFHALMSGRLNRIPVALVSLPQP